MRAYKNNGTGNDFSTWSSAKSVKIIAVNTPNPASAVNVSSGVTFKWSKVSGANGYYVYRKTISGGWTRIADVKGAGTVSYTDKKAQNGVTYAYTVRAYKGSVLSSYSKSGKMIVRMTIKTPRLSNSGKKKMKVKWGKNSKATGYQIQYSTSSKFKKSKRVTVKGAAKVSKVISKLTRGKKYYVKVRAYKTYNKVKYFSSWSKVKKIKIKK